MLSACVSCAAIPIVSAANHTAVSIEEYEYALSEAYAAYGIGFEVLDYDSDIEITEAMLDSELEKVEANVNSMTITISNEVPANFGFESPVHRRAHGITRAMPVRTTAYGFISLSSNYGGCVLRSEADVTIDVQNSYISNVHSYSTYQTGAFVNFDDWTTTSMSVSANNPSYGYLKMTVSGRARFSYADPLSGVTTGYTQTVTNRVVNVDVGDFV